MWLADRDRYSYEGLNSPDRLQKPMIKSEAGEWIQVDWHQALTVALEQVQKTLHQQGPQEVGALISPNASVEEHYLLQKFCREHKIGHIDHRVFQQNNKNQYSLPSYPTLGVSLDELEKTDVIVLIGTNIHKDVPLLAHRILKAQKNGAKVVMINPVHFSTNFNTEYEIVCTHGDMIKPLASILKATGATKHTTLLSGVSAEATEQSVAQLLAQPGKKAVFLGPLAISHPHFDELYFLATEWAKLAQASFGLLSHGGNSAGAYIAGSIPDASGFGAHEMLAKNLKTYLLYQIDPEIDCPHPGKAKLALSQAEHVIAFTSYASETLKKYATVLLPVVPFSETAGTYVNALGQWQTVDAAVTPLGEARPGWKVLRVLGNLFKLEGFEYQHSNEILAEVKTQLANRPGKSVYHTDYVPPKLNIISSPMHSDKALIRIAPVGLYQIDNVTRRAAALQKTADNQQTQFVYLNKTEAQKRELFDGHPVRLVQLDSNVASDPLLLRVSDKLPDGVVLAYHGISELGAIGGQGEWVDVQPVDSSIV